MCLGFWSRLSQSVGERRRGSRYKNNEEKHSQSPPSSDGSIDFYSKQDSIVSSIKIPTTQEPATPTGQALLVNASRGYTLDPKFPLPQVLRSDEVAIRNYAIGLNPIDWKSVEYNFCLPQLPWITGRESAGIVDQIGSAVDGLAVGQRVWTSTYYKDVRAGCFQERIVVPGHTVLPIPENLTFEEAATLGVAGVTAAMVLWKWLGLSQPGESNGQAQVREQEDFLLVWGGSTVTGQWVTQLAALSNVRSISVCARATEELSYSCGATKVVTRDGKSSQQVVEEIRAIAGDRVTLALDLVGEETSSACLEAVSKTMPVRMAPLAAMPKTCSPAENVEIVSVEMKQFVLHSRNRIFAETLNRLVKSGRVRCPGIKVLEGGLAVVPKGLEMVKSGQLRGQRVVIKM